jgi:Flp pilus assembly pilin Flp
VLQLGLMTHLRVRLYQFAAGQTMTEYALILLAVAVIVYASYQALGTTISTNLTSVNKLF